MNMSSRNVESSSVGTTPQPTEKQLRDAIALILRSLQRGPSALIELPDFKQLVAIVANVPSSQVGPYNKSNAVALNRTQATPSCVECGQCGEMFVNANDHDKHVREAHFAIPKGNLCNICQKYFNTAANLHLHRTQEHSALSSIKFCPFCHLEVLESIHTHNKEHHPNACLACKTDFQSAQERALHDGAVHKRKFTCHTCWRTFTEKTHLTQHQTDSHKVVCRKCGPEKQFTSMQAYEAHCNVKHSRPDSGTRPSPTPADLRIRSF